MSFAICSSRLSSSCADARISLTASLNWPAAFCRNSSLISSNSRSARRPAVSACEGSSCSRASDALRTFSRVCSSCSLASCISCWFSGSCIRSPSSSVSRSRSCCCSRKRFSCRLISSRSCSVSACSSDDCNSASCLFKSSWRLASSRNRFRTWRISRSSCSCSVCSSACCSASYRLSSCLSSN